MDIYVSSWYIEILPIQFAHKYPVLTGSEMVKFHAQNL